LVAPVIHWFRNDLRLVENAALSAALAEGRPVVCVFVFDHTSPGDWAAGGAKRWWLHHSLAGLRSDLRERGGDLILREGTAVDEVVRVAQDAGADVVFFSRRYEPWAVDEEKVLSARLEPIGIRARRFGGTLLLEPESIATAEGNPYKVFTPFYRAALPMVGEAPVKAPPSRMAAREGTVGGLDLDDLGLLPRPDWAAGLRDAWTPGERGAQEALDRFVDQALQGYREGRDVPGAHGTSRLSPHLAFGELSPRQCIARVRMEIAREPALGGGGEAFVRELMWREFCHHLLFHWSDLPSAPFRASFEAFPWRDSETDLEAWRQGRTGYPLVDAGMRELWHTGWMHNRVRMVAASFLVKHLLIPWQEGERWFWDTLVDADLANNAANWQWVAGCGADAAPYFRIFNPIAQSEKFDPEGAYLRRWLPELAGLPDKHLHRPWAAPADILQQAGVRIGPDYPAPIVEHSVARTRALSAFEEVRAAGATKR